MQNLTIDSIIQVIGEIVPPDTSIAVANSKKFIYYHPSKQVNLNIRPGDQIHEDTVTFKALAHQRKTSQHIDEHLFGTPYYGISIPIVQNGQPQGCITSILPREAFQFSTPFLTIRTNDRWIPTSFEDIIFIEAQNRKTKVQSINHFGSHKMNLSQLELFLPDHFFRSHRSYMINLNHIVEIHPDSHSTFMLIMKDGFKVPVSQTYASEFRRLLHF